MSRCGKSGNSSYETRMAKMCPRLAASKHSRVFPVGNAPNPPPKVKARSLRDAAGCRRRRSSFGGRRAAPAARPMLRAFGALAGVSEVMIGRRQRVGGS